MALFQCNVCLKSFKCVDNLNRHKKTIYEKKQRFNVNSVKRLSAELTIKNNTRKFVVSSGEYLKLGAWGKIQIRGPQNDVTFEMSILPMPARKIGYEILEKNWFWYGTWNNSN